MATRTFRIGNFIGLLVALIFCAQALYTILPTFLKKTDNSAILRADGAKLDPLDVVLIADESGPNKNIGNDIAQGFRDALRASRVENEVRLISRDNEGNPEMVSAIAAGSAAGFRTLAIVGPTEGQSFQALRDATNEGEVVGLVPIGSPLNEENGKWTFTLQSSTYKNGIILGRVLQRVSPDGNLVQFVMEGSPRDGLYDGLLESFSGTGIEAIDQAYWPKDSSNPEEIKNLLSQNLYHDAIIISLPMKEAETILRELRAYGYPGTVIFEGEASLEYFASNFKGDSKEALKEGYFTNGAISLVPFTPSIARAESQKLISDYRQTKNQDPSWAYSYGYDAGLLISNFVNENKKNETFTLANPDSMRQKLREYLANSRLSASTSIGFTGALAFEKNNTRNQSPKLVIYNERKQIPYFVQVSDEPMLIDINDKNQDYVRIGEYGYRVIPVVHTGLNLRSINNINFDQGIFDATFDIWFKSKISIDINDIEFMNMVGVPTDSVKSTEKKAPTGDYFQGYILSGKFRFNPKPADLILDQSSMGISWRHRSLNAKQLTFVVDPEVYDTAINTARQEHDSSAKAAVSGFSVKDSLLAVYDTQLKALGDPRGSHGITSYSVATYQVDLQRKLATATSQIFNTLGEALLHQSLLISSGIFLLITVIAFFKPSTLMSVVCFTALIAMAMLSETALFTLPVTRSLDTESLAWIRISYDLIYIFVGIRLIDTLFMTFLRRKNQAKGIQPVIIFLTRVSLYFSGAAVFYMGVLNRDILPVLATTSVLLTVIGLALRELIFDAIAGVAISSDGNLKIGDWVKFRTREVNVTGQIEMLSWRFISVRARDGNLHLIPNSRVATQVLSHLSMGSDYIRVDIPFYMLAEINTEAFIPKLTQAVEVALANHPSVDHSKPIRTVLDGLQDNSLLCIVQVFYLSSASEGTLRTLVLEVVRKHLTLANAIGMGSDRSMTYRPV